jgi:hypothetical protein
MRPVPDFKLVPHVGPDVEVISELLGNTVVVLVQVAVFAGLVQLVPVQVGMTEKVFGVIALFGVPYRLMTRFEPVQAAKVAELHSVSPYGT